jgi:lipoate-protein ligase A
MIRMKAARLLIDPPMPGPANMARDEALLQGCRGDAAAPILRFYAWSPATISLGYFQEYGEYKQLAPPAGELGVVRRTTGGGAILHDLELTYSIVMPAGHTLVKGRPQHLYTLAHQAVISAIGHGVRLLGRDGSACDSADASATHQEAGIQRGPFFCFARRHGLDVVIADCRGPAGFSKIAGSAQRRTAGAILQHGSIMLDSRYVQQPVATWSDLDRKAVDFAQAAERLAPEFEKQLGVVFESSSWQEQELNAADVIEERYAGAAWNVHRRR